MAIPRLPPNLPRLLRAAGLTVVEIDGWKTRTRPGDTAFTGVLNHHTGASARGWSRAKELQYAKWMFLTGRADLPAPLCQIALGRSGVVYVGAAGRANHAGTAKASGSVAAGDGNRLYVGIEWMLSGTEAIPAAMTEAGIVLNAVLTEKVLNTSVRTISSHYQTSVTGKWDIGDPNGIRFKDKRVLDVDKFRSAVEEKRQELYRPETTPAPEQDHYDVLVGHFSAQHSDNIDQWRHDLDRVMSRNYQWITGTEAGFNRHWKQVKAAAKKHGFRVVRFAGEWIAVRKNIIKKGTFSRGGERVVHKSDLVGKMRDRSILWVTFTHRRDGVGKISVIASHYAIKGKPKAKNPDMRVNLEANRALAEAISKKARELGKGKSLCFYGGDQNISDKHSDTFFGGPLITSWDDLKKWPDTGHGNIDVIARFKRDNRVKCIGGRRFTDKQLFLYSDHFLIQARYRIRC